MALTSAELHSPGRVVLGGTPDGQDARVLADLARLSGAPGLLHVATDDQRAARLAAAVGFFAPKVEVMVFPAWDCLPYDRVSPNPDVSARRLDVLTRLADRLAGDRVAGAWLVIATVNGLLQRVPAPDDLAGSGFTAEIGDVIDLEGLQAFLGRNGYGRAQTVREPGEFAIRGGIIDLFPPGSEEPVRLDLLGDELEAVRGFDPLSQRTTGEKVGVTLKPMAELRLDAESIARFRSGYRGLFGAVVGEDPLYEAVSAGRRHAGMEHWLPLFHDRMATLFEYLPQAPVTIDHQADAARSSRITQIDDFFQARMTLLSAATKSSAQTYKPLPPSQLYLMGGELDRCLSDRWVGDMTPFAAATGGVRVIDCGGRRGRDFADIRANPDANVFNAVREHAALKRADGRRLFVAGYTAGARDRLVTVLAEHGMGELKPVDSFARARKLPAGHAAAIVLPLEHGFEAPDLAVITEQDILGDRLARPARKRRKADEFLQEVSALTQGDFVVHVDHGIGRYEGLETVTAGGAPHDCLRLVYAGDDKLFVPVENIEVLSRYGSAEAGATLDRLGGAGWQARKARVKKRLKDMADELMRVAAARELRRGDTLPPPDGVYEEFAARFPYPETDDQLRAIEEVLDDLVSGQVMDRLVCGDVGFGKTEVAMRAAFVAAMNGRQVAVVVPTTLLARQHFRNFSSRFKGLPLRVEQLSRLVPPKDQKAVKEGLADGSVNVVVGTHALLAKTIAFDTLGLMIVDEEQHFGVKQKERLKQFRADVHVLTLTATPIPRTLQMALSGVRELSLIATPPVDRLAVRTFVLPFDGMVIREAILREHFRGGQTFYVCPRIDDLKGVEDELKSLVPEVRVVTAHGRMPPTQIEEIMTAFYDGQFDVLLSTTIVESGLDVPSANTMILHRADMFGLAQLYQLRGRIGRSKLRGYAYLTYDAAKKLTKTAEQRLHVIEQLDSLGAGFSLASHDMDIRGAGNLLGEEQSGHVREVGVELYQQMLEEAVAAARSGALELDADANEPWSPTINLGIPVLIPVAYVPDLNVRMDLYRRLSRLADRAELDGFAAELIDRFGPLPEEVENLLALMVLKQLCKEAGVERLDVGPKGAVVAFRNNSFVKPDKLLAFIGQHPKILKVRPDQRVVYTQNWRDEAARMDGARKLMRRLSKLAA